MARKKKSESGPEAAAIVAQGGALADVAVTSCPAEVPANPVPVVAETPMPSVPEAGNGATRPARRTRPNRQERLPDELLASARALQEQVQRAGEVVLEAATQAKGLHAEAAQVRQQLDAAMQEARQGANDTLKQIEEARQEVKTAAKQFDDSASTGEQAIERLEAVRRRADVVAGEVEQILQRARERAEAIHRIERELQGTGHSLLEDMRLELQGIRQEGREALSRLDEAIPQPTEPVVPPPLPEQTVAVRPETDRVVPTALDGSEVMQVTVRSELPSERLVRYLQTAWSVKATVLDTLQDLADESVEPTFRATLAEHRRLTQQQKQELEGRLHALGSEPAGGKGALQRFVGWIWESWQREPDDYDRTVQNLLKALAVQQFETNAHEVVAALASALGDQETAELSGRHAHEKRQATEQLQPFVTALPTLAAAIADQTQQAVVALAATERE